MVHVEVWSSNIYQHSKEDEIEKEEQKPDHEYFGCHAQEAKLYPESHGEPLAHLEKLNARFYISER